MFITLKWIISEAKTFAFNYNLFLIGKNVIIKISPNHLTSSFRL